MIGGLGIQDVQLHLRKPMHTKRTNVDSDSTRFLRVPVGSSMTLTLLLSRWGHDSKSQVQTDEHQRTTCKMFFDGLVDTFCGEGGCSSKTQQSRCALPCRCEGLAACMSLFATRTPTCQR
uniref:Uncharacterized protein n=1 Tax=Noctiluca scintillans TaxID=2966 RepID=A0A7S1F591_NOCSC|mmetsp:Transcript_34976/g.93325  ORF Transcript_34976/g.93325 Transcript_34976/m.93325 type:complete len:120 (+) Transcript_34976:53-412(+)